MRKWLSIAFIAIGFFVFGYSLYSFYGQQDLVNEIPTSDPDNEEVVSIDEPSSLTRFIDKIAPINTATPIQTVIYPVRPSNGQHLGELILPTLQASMPIIEGANEDELEKGVGHVSQTVLPGEADQAVLSGHRDTVFRRVGELKIGDSLIVQTKMGRFTYAIEKTWIVDAEDRSVIRSVSEPILLLTTCYPFDFFGNAPQRYIIQARLVESNISGYK